MIRVGITQGDINGIGPEIIIKTFADQRLSEMIIPVIYGSSKVFSFYRKCCQEGESFSYQLIKDASEARSKKVSLIETSAGEVRIEPGVATEDGGTAAVAALERAAQDLALGKIDVLVTAPINKENVQGTGFGFTGHTEFLAARFDGNPVMVMCSDIMKVGLATVHIPLADVSASLSQELIINRLNQLRGMLKRDFRIVEPRIAVLALNPHCGDGGLIGNEESQIIKPAIRTAYESGVLAFGPFPADGFFAAGSHTDYDAILAMYHDQGLAPFKALTPEGVNYTASLPVVRTSPDHGVAYDIAGKGTADCSSMRAAVFLAVDIFRNRLWFDQINANPLKHYERERGADVSVSDLKLPEQDD